MINESSIRGFQACLSVVIGVLVAICFAAPSLAETPSDVVPGQDAIEDLELTGDFLCELDGADLTDAEIYVSQRHVAYLVVAPSLPAPLLISPRGESVQSVQRQKLTRADGRATLAADFRLEYLGEYDLRGGEMIFELDGKTAKLKPKPPLLGRQTFPELERHDPKYAFNAMAHRQSKTAAATAPPIPGENVRIRVYFGSWSEICKLLVPKMQQVEEDWRTHGVRFEYYGLPRPIIDDPHAVEMGIVGVPTAVVFVGDEEIGRLTGRALDTPEESLHRILADPTQ